MSTKALPFLTFSLSVFQDALGISIIVLSSPSFLFLSEYTPSIDCVYVGIFERSSEVCEPLIGLQQALGWLCDLLTLGDRVSAPVGDDLSEPTLKWLTMGPEELLSLSLSNDFDLDGFFITFEASK